MCVCIGRVCVSVCICVCVLVCILGVCVGVCIGCVCVFVCVFVWVCATQSTPFFLVVLYMSDIHFTVYVHSDFLMNVNLKLQNQTEQKYSQPTTSTILDISFIVNTTVYVTVDIAKYYFNGDSKLLSFAMSSDQGYVSNNLTDRKWLCYFPVVMYLESYNGETNQYRCVRSSNLDKSYITADKMQNVNKADVFAHLKGTDYLYVTNANITCTTCTLKLCKYFKKFFYVTKSSNVLMYILT